jgi:hypothetical protein
MLHPTNPPFIPMGTPTKETDLQKRIKIVPFEPTFKEYPPVPVLLNVFECVPCGGNKALIRISIEEYADKVMRHTHQTTTTDKWIQVGGPITGPLNNGTIIYIEGDGKLTYKYGQTGMKPDEKYRGCVTREYAGGTNTQQKTELTKSEPSREREGSALPLAEVPTLIH